MRYQVRGRRALVPNVTTNKAQPQPFDYTKGLFSSKSNDLQPEKTLQYITDMRFRALGKYITRKGCDFYSVPIGETVNVSVTSTTGATDVPFSYTSWVAQKLTATASNVATKIEVNIKNPNGSGNTVVVALYSDNAGSPGTELASSTIAASDVGTSYAYESVRLMAAPAITNATAYWVVVYLQSNNNDEMYISSTTTSTNAKTSASMGNSWTTQTYSLNAKLSTATAGGVKGLTRIYRPSGQAITYFAHGSNVYSVNDNDGVTTSIDSSLNSSATHVRFEYVNDVLYYTDGLSKPHKYDFSTASVVTAAPYNASNILEHVGLLFYVDPDDPTRMFYTNFAEYETFTSTDFIYVPAPKKSDHIKALQKLNGVLYPITRRNKYMLLGQDNATFRLDEALAQKGTFSQESTIADENYIYFASEDGVYKFNGTSEKNILEPIIDEYTDLLYKEDIHLQLYNNRLYIWYRPNGDSQVNKCFVYNTLYDVVESADENTYVGRSFARHDSGDNFLQASNRTGAVYYGEKSTNDYCNLGSKLVAETRTAFDHFGSPQQLKRITYWRPIIETAQGAYSMQAGFAANETDDVNYFDVSLQGTGFTYDSPDALYDSATYSSPASSTDTTLNIYGSAYRWQRRYKHHAAREPFIFAGEVLKVEVQRLR